MPTMQLGILSCVNLDFATLAQQVFAKEYAILIPKGFNFSRPRIHSGLITHIPSCVPIGTRYGVPIGTLEYFHLIKPGMNSEPIIV